MAAEDTILDAPVTPAPLFAYRALRGMLFGSPDSPGVNHFRTDGSEDNKENEPRETNKITRSVTNAVAWTPTQKRSRSTGANSMLSPTKSCLRTPGAVTPRRALLRDVNVTFMDAASRSLTPEILSADLGGSEKQTIQKDMKRNLPVQQLQANGKKAGTIVKSVRNVPLIAPSAQNRQSSQPPPTTDQFDVQTYMSTTEKEMKKLIRYSQKMREYARKQDEENTKLKQLVDQLQQENARLKRKGDSIEEESSGALDRGSDMRNIDTRPDHKRRKLGGNNMADQDDGSRTALGNLQSNHLNARGVLDPNSQPLKHSTTRSDITQREVQAEPQTTQSTTIPLRISPRTAQALTMTAIPATNKPSTTINANLAPDRLAAARARIRQRSEMRKASATIDQDIYVEPVGSDNQYRPAISSRDVGTKKQPDRLSAIRNENRDDIKDKDSSMLDWAGL